MNKYDLEKSLRTLRETDLALTATYQGKAQPATASSRQRAVKSIPARRQHMLLNEFPPGVNPEDWEPDDEGDRGPVVSQYPEESDWAFRPWSEYF